MEPEIGVLVFDLVPVDEFSDSGENVNDLDLGRDALIKFVRQLPDYSWHRHVAIPQQDSMMQVLGISTMGECF